jgi:hypothetical protein
VAFAGWTFLSGNHWSRGVRVPNHASEPRAPYFLDVTPGFFEAMGIGWIDGRDFRPGDVQERLNEQKQPIAGVGIVNEAFARAYFDGQNPVGRVVDVQEGNDAVVPMQIVGYVRDAVYSNVREGMRPTVFVPIHQRNDGAFIVRTAADPRAMAPVLRRAASQAGPGLGVRNVDIQSALVRSQMVRERLLATLSLFFAAVGLVLAAIGLYGVLHYSVVQQRREIGIRMALGAGSARVVRHVSAGLLGMVCVGAAAGLAGGVASTRFIETLLFEVKATDSGIVAVPLLMLLGAAVLAALPPAIRAVRIDPAQTLRSE